MCCLFTALGTNERFSAGKCTAVRLQFFNEAYTQRVKWMKEQDNWRVQLGKPVTDITPEQSIQDRVKEVNTRTQETPISYKQAGVVKIARNEFASLLDKIWDKDGKIPTGKQASDTREALRVTWFNSITGDNPPEPVSSEDEDTKTETKSERLVTFRAKKLKFHPMYQYLYFHFGSAAVGG